MSQSRKIRLGAVLGGAGGPGEHGAWKEQEIPGNASINIEYYLRQAQLAERGKFDHLFVVDSLYITPDSPPHYLNRLEPFTLLGALAVQTRNIGLVATISTSYEEPFHVARRLASIDLISGGRAGWNVVATGDGGTAKLFGRGQHLEYEDRYGRALEHVQLVQKLWDSYEDEAFPRDVETGTFVDVEKLHPVEHRGKYFTVEGPLNISRSPQGQPVIFQAGDSEYGRNLAGAIAEGVFTHQPTIEAGIAFSRDIKARAEKAGRNPDHVLITPGIKVIVGDSDEHAREIEQYFQDQDADFTRAVKLFGRPFGWHDFNQYDLDAPFPDLGDLGDRDWKTRADQIKTTAREGGLTLRETVERFTAPQPSPFVGSAETVASTLQEWFEAGAVDGYNIHIRTLSQFARFTEEVVPLLQERGLFRAEYEGSTLREHLGLPFIANRHLQREAVPTGT
ncbi:LLM class flavin-dependent oxidoreductase [Nesterenkonia flava]|uniref:LLM class flavin-dependent oxidoreductase n=1 Tax=Nesterenkonia flava TaxID=469799 RepID=A0ABU1FUW7_9MICC|nr:LLM class flavin-dependent oxidoreductase [Nesterenkonia flava]MDR5712142.1 LLM class flavin-dependent oxidoreductase [Nesterenkonia flava]